MRPEFVLPLFAALLAAGIAGAGECRLDSPAHRVTVVELYTSEGCSSCPPADRWLSGLAAEGIGPAQAIPLAFHVDYWNTLGWPDRFSQAAFSERQRAVAVRGGARFVYTPQVIVDGRDFRAWGSGALRPRLRDVNGEAAAARIDARVLREGASLSVQGAVRGAGGLPAQAWIAVYEDGLSTEVRAGENQGARLAHDHVVRRLAGPFPLDGRSGANLDWRTTVPADWDAARLGVAVFAEQPRTGVVLTAAACAAP
ncbi:MAG TPA: DUF1223 domain-containing protein [Burkholderiales bacterium]|nr:DUF1223 domain-containing protein [Burkholderiales bacterium]